MLNVLLWRMYSLPILLTFRLPSFFCDHWRRLGKNIGWANQNIGGGKRGLKSYKCMGDSQLLGGTCRAAPPPKSMPMFVTSANFTGGPPCLLILLYWRSAHSGLL